MDYVASFLDYMQHVRGCSNATFLGYRGDLNAFFKVVKVPPESVAKIHIQQFVSSQRTSSKSARTINRRLDCLSSFYQYLIDELEVPLKNPVRREYKQKVKDRVSSRAKRILPDDARRILKVTRTQDKIAYMAMLLMGKQGLRISEVTKIKLEDIDFNENKMTIRGSKGEDRIIPLTDTVKSEIKWFVGYRTTGCVVLHSEGKPYTAIQGLWARIRYWQDRLGIPGTPHSWRRLAGTELYRKTQDIVFVQQILGHRSLETTRSSYVDDVGDSETSRKIMDETF